MSNFMLLGSALLMVAGASFTLIAAIGLMRLPDLYTRSHAASKAGTLGAGLILMSLALFSNELDVITRAFAAFIFFLLTAPIAAHLLARSAYIVGYKPYHNTNINDMTTYRQKEINSTKS